MKIEIDSKVYSEFKYMLKLLKKQPQAEQIGINIPETTEALINKALDHLATGSRRPDSWERSLIHSMGFVSDADEHHTYREEYGEPKE